MFVDECLNELTAQGYDTTFLAEPEILDVNSTNAKSFKQKNMLAFTYTDIGGTSSNGRVVFAYKDKDLKFYSLDIYTHQDLFAILCEDLFKNMSENGSLDTFVNMSNNSEWSYIPTLDSNYCYLKSEYKRKMLTLCRFLVSYNNSVIAMQLLFDDKYEKERKFLLTKHYSNFLGAIAGDIIGSIFEFHPIDTKGFPLFSTRNFLDENGQPTIASQLVTHFTDDSVMSFAICSALLDCNNDYTNLRKLTVKKMQELGLKYPHAGYGYNFKQWLREENPMPYNSLGNGSAMRVSAVPYFATSDNQQKNLTNAVTDVTHNHPEGLKGAEAISKAIWLIFKGANKEQIKTEMEKYYNLDFNFDDLRQNYGFDETCPGSVPQSIYAFLISDSFEDTVRNAIVMRGDADTMACIAGALAGAYYGVPEIIKEKTKYFLSPELLKIYNDFIDKMCN